MLVVGLVVGVVGVGVVGGWLLVVVAVGVLGMCALAMWSVLLMLGFVPLFQCHTETLCPSGQGDGFEIHWALPAGVRIPSVS